MHRELTRAAFAIGKRFAGFTLTEIVIASVLLIITIVPILEGLTIAQRNIKVIERKTRSLVLAQAKLDEIKAYLIYHYTDTYNQDDLSLDGLYLCDITDTSAGKNLREITISAGYDLDENTQLASDEVLVTLGTLIAKRW